MEIRNHYRRNMERKAVNEQAAEWLMLLSDNGADANAAFAEWLRESPTHVQAYLRAATLDTMLRRIDPELPVELAPLPPGAVADIEPDLNVRPFEPRVFAGPKRSRWLMAASVAVLGVALATAWFVFGGGAWDTYQTDVGEQRAVELSDGSTLTMNTGSRVRVRFTDDGRELRLLAGEAIFRVQRDPARPFTVHSGKVQVQAVGTAFNVYKRMDQTIVSVIDGRVSVRPSATSGISPALLEAGEGIRVDDNGTMSARSPVNIANVTAWRQRRLVFIDEPLASIGYELNRYSRTLKIRIEGAVAQNLRYAAILDADDPESLLAVLSGDPRVAVEHNGREIVIRER